MKIASALLVLTIFTAGLTGCIAQPQHDDLRTLYRNCQERVVELEAQIESLNADLDAARGTTAGPDQATLDQLAAAQAEIDRLRQQLKDLAAGPQTGDLSAELVSALEALAKQYPGLMSFDADRKMIKLESDLTFALGSVTVKRAAADSLAKLAGVLKSADAAIFEVRVVGHTDNVPITNAANKAKYGNNWGLSAYRAKSVMEVLKANGISEKRMSIAGYGEHQPVVANPARGGAQANRRVEIYLVTPYNATASAPAPAPAEAPAATVETTTTSPDEQPVQFK